MVQNEITRKELILGLENIASSMSLLMDNYYAGDSFEYKSFSKMLIIIDGLLENLVED